MSTPETSVAERGPHVTGLQTDYLVVGAGAMGMAFTDALVDHADATDRLAAHADQGLA